LYEFGLVPRHFAIVEQRMLTVEENGGCLGNHEIFVTVLDVNGNPLDGVIVGDTFDNIEVASGDKGPGATEVTLWMNSMSLKVKRHIDGTAILILAQRETNPFAKTGDKG